MEIKQEIITMLDMLSQPAFLADKEKIRYVNTAARMYLLQPDIRMTELLGEQWPVYQSFLGDSLYCKLHIGLKPICATVTALEGCCLFSFCPFGFVFSFIFRPHFLFPRAGFCR